MATDPLAILSVAQFKTAIRLVGTDPDIDRLLAGYIEGAGGWVEELCELGIVDTAVVECVDVPGGDRPLVIRHRAPVIHSFKWRRAVDIGGAYTDAPVTPGEAGERLSTVAAPSGGWPGGSLAIVYVRSMPADEVPGDVRAAMVLWTKAAFDAEQEFGGPRSAAVRLLTPHRAVG